MSRIILVASTLVGASLVLATTALAQGGPAAAAPTGPAATAPATPATMPVAVAHAKATAREIVLVDVRTPQEWQQTGVPASAHAVTMHQDGPAMLAQLDRLLGGDRSKPLAVICRTGNRTSALVTQLRRLGYTRVIDVSEGMAGSRSGPGWLRSGLPTRPGADAARPPVIAAQ